MVTGLSQGPVCTRLSQFMREGPHTSAPSTCVDAIHHLTDIVGQLGDQNDESTVAKSSCLYHPESMLSQIEISRHSEVTARQILD